MQYLITQPNVSTVGTRTTGVTPLAPVRPRSGVDEKSAAQSLWIAGGTLFAIGLHLLLRFGHLSAPGGALWPLWAALAFGGIPLIAELLVKAWRRQFGSDLLAGLSIVTSILLGEYLAGTLVVLMLSGGQALEGFAVRRASSILNALAKRLPTVAHRQTGNHMSDVALIDVAVGDTLKIFPHEICPTDGEVIDGHGVMDEAYLTGEPFRIAKVPGAAVLSGAINGASALTIRVTRPAADSRYARIMRVVTACENDPPRLRRLGDKLGAAYTPLAVAIALATWLISGESTRFLAVLVIATPCPLLIGIPVSVIGAISQCARRGIIVKRPAVLEQVSTCRTIIFDKTGTLTYGEPHLTDVVVAAPFQHDEVLTLAASVERYSKHPLAGAVLRAADEQRLPLKPAGRISEPPGSGLVGTIEGRRVEITGRARAVARFPDLAARLPEVAGGLECVLLIDDQYAATFRFRDTPRTDSTAFISHLVPRHHFTRSLIVSGDRESEVRFLADQVGIDEVHAGKSPEEKLAIVRAETGKARTLYLGDGINDAPALLSADVGIALGQGSDVTTEAAGAVIMDRSLTKVDEFLHISSRMRRIALQTAIGGMTLSVVGMALAARGLISPVAGAVTQEVIDVLAILNALRAALPPRVRSDI